MNPTPRSSSFRAKHALVGAAIAFVFAASTVAVAETAQPSPANVATPILSSDASVQKDLGKLDQFLDQSSNLKFEEVLRKNVDQLEGTEFRKSNPEIAVVLTEKPWIVPALKAERHFLIHRYVVRRAHGPLLRPSIQALDRFLAEHPAIRKALDTDPSQILDAKFLIANPSLAEFFGKHPDLSTALLEKQEPHSKPKNR